MELSKTDAATTIQLLEKMAAYIYEQSDKPKEINLARRANLMAKKIKKSVLTIKILDNEKVHWNKRSEGYAYDTG